MKRDDEIYAILEWLLGKEDAAKVKDNAESILNAYWYAEMLRFVTVAKLIRDLRDEVERLKREIEELRESIKNGVA